MEQDNPNHGLEIDLRLHNENAFPQYLDQQGVFYALTRILQDLYEMTTKPEDPLKYIRDQLAIITGVPTHDEMQANLEKIEKKISDIEKKANDAK